MKRVSFLRDLKFGDKPQISVMMETPSSKEIRICMKEGNIMQEHTAPGAITIMLLRGKLLLTSNSKDEILEDGDIVYFDAKVPHSLEALDECVVRLILSKNDTASRVQKLVGILNP